MFIGSHVDIDISSFVNILFMTFADFPIGVFVLVNFRSISPLCIINNFPSCVFLVHSQCLPDKSSSFVCRLIY